MRLCLYMVSLKKAEEDVVAAQALMERKLQEALGDRQDRSTLVECAAGTGTDAGCLE